MAVTANPDIKTRSITKDTEFIICACDGIWDCMTSQQAVDFTKMAKLKQMEFQCASPALKAMGSPSKTSKFANSKASSFTN